MTENNQQRPKLIASFSGVSAAPPRLIHHKSPITHRRLTPFLFSTNKPHRIIIPMRAPLKTKDKQFSIQYKLTVGSICLPAALFSKGGRDAFPKTPTASIPVICFRVELHLGTEPPRHGCAASRTANDPSSPRGSRCSRCDRWRNGNGKSDRNRRT